MPTLSIIIPVYNSEEFLSECIESVLTQTLKELEIIIIDDGSSDHCMEVCEKYSKEDKRIILVHQNNKGLSSARNKGLKLATGDYIFFLDGNHKIFSPDTLYKMFSEIHTNQYDILVGQIFDQDGQTVDYDFEGMKQMRGKDAMIRLIKENKFPVNVCANLYRSSLFHQNGLLFVEGTVFEDEEILPKLFYYAKKIGSTKEYSYLNTYHDTSAASSGGERAVLKKIVGWVIAADQTYKFFMKRKDFSEEDQSVMMHRCSLFYLRAIMSSYAIKNEKYLTIMNKAISRAHYLILPGKPRHIKFRILSVIIRIFGTDRAIILIRKTGKLINY